MKELPGLSINDKHHCRFLLFDNLSALWAEAGAEHAAAADSRPLIIIDENVRRLHEDLISKTFPAGSSRWFTVPSGESSKSTEKWEEIIDFAFSGPLRRNTPLVAIGGGVTGDLAGFAAACLMRGLPLFHVPTTLLSMVDSAIGGKTGINHAFGKNTIGAFYHPQAVLFDTRFLETLPRREWLCGISEILKYGYISRPELLGDASDLADPGTRSTDLLERVVENSVRIKSGIVAGDAREAGRRAWLNFGHTFAHALETLDNYRNINHGEAVYVGMIAALFVSRLFNPDKKSELSDQPLLTLKNIYNLDLSDYTTESGRLVTLMSHDKKNRDHSIRLVLLDGSGQPDVKAVDDPVILRDAWQYTFDVLK